MSNEKKRNPVISGILSLIMSGLGQVYNGQPLKGLVFFAITTISGMLMIYLRLFTSFYGLIGAFSLVIILKIAIIIDAIVVAMKKKKIILQPYNKWFVYLAMFLVGIVISPDPVSVKEKVGFSAKIVVSASMTPTLAPGDRIIADLKYYHSNEPQRGEIALVEYEDRPGTQYLGRIIATAGETIEIRNGVIFINGKEIKENYITKGNDSYGPYEIPNDGVFVLGDNRSNSYDSRMRGYVRLGNLKGKYLYTYISGK